MKNIDFTKFYIIEDYNKYSYAFDMDFNKKEKKIINYLEYYKDIYEKMKRLKKLSDIDKVRLITDIKRLVDCRCAMILENLGYLEPITKENYPELLRINELKNLNKMTLISYLMDINLEIIFKVRKIRNTVEHEYYIPSTEEIKESFSSCELFLIVLKSMFSSDKFKYYEITSYNTDKVITIQPYKTEDGLGNINLTGVKYTSKDKEYTILLRYILSRKFDNIPKELFKVNSSMPDERIKCIGIQDAKFYEDIFDFEQNELCLEETLDYI